MESFSISSSKRLETIDINDNVSDVVRDSDVDKGLCVVFVPHSTAGVIINENWDEKVGEDFQDLLSSLIPEGEWLHDEIDGNGDSHIKSSIIGPSEYIPIVDGELGLGKWQNVMLAEFDGPKTRNVFIKIMEG